MQTTPIDLKNRYLALFLAWLVPGLGHFYQRRIGKGILYCVLILGLYFTGLILGNWRVVYWRWQNPLTNSDQFCLSYLGQFWTGLVALPALIQATLIYYGKDVILNGFMAVPSPIEMNGMYPNLGRFVENGYLYTSVAGLLNIFAMYDAFEGPATLQEPAQRASAPATKGAKS